MLKKGDVLKNGATVLAVRNNTVLADRGNVYEPYVTWEFRAADGSDTFWGHYFSDLTTAVLDFEERADRNGKQAYAA